MCKGEPGGREKKEEHWEGWISRVIWELKMGCSVK